MIWLLLWVAIFFITSCGPAYKVRRAEKLIKESGLPWKIDTVFQTVNVPVPEVHTDTVVVSKPMDTVYLTKERLSVKVVRKYDTLRIDADCLPDTIKVEVPVVVNKEINCPKPKLNFWDIVKTAVIAGVIGFVAGKFRTIFR